MPRHNKTQAIELARARIKLEMERLALTAARRQSAINSAHTRKPEFGNSMDLLKHSASFAHAEQEIDKIRFQRMILRLDKAIDKERQILESERALALEELPAHEVS